jgi:hypothetical protein
MFASLKNGDLASCYYKLPGLYNGKDEVRYALTTYTVAMRKNLAAGNPIFTGIRKLEEEIELAETEATTTTTTTTETEATENYDEELVTPHQHHRVHQTSSQDDPNYKIQRDNAAFAEIIAKELAFLNRTIQMISLVASRYHEEQEDIACDWGNRDIETGDEVGSGETGDEVGSGNGYYDNDDDVPTPRACASSPPLTRSQSHSFGDIYSADYNDPRPKNQLANTLLIGSGQLQQQFLGLCVLAGTDITLVNAITTLDRPITEASFEKKQRALTLVVSSIYTEFSQFHAENRAPVVRVFQSLRDISSAAWAMMSMLAFSNLFRLTHGTDFETTPINPDDAIFSNQGRPFRPRMGHCAVTMPDSLRIRIHGEDSGIAVAVTADE